MSRALTSIAETNMTAKISIVTVNYNNAALLIEVLDRTLDILSSYPVEVIVVDNGSPDDSFEILKSYYAKSDRVNVIASGRNGGFGFGCNAGAAVATTDILWFLNSDAWVSSTEGLDDAVKLLQNTTVGLVGTSVLLDNAEPTPQGGSDMTFSYFLLSSFRPGALFRKIPLSVKRLIVPLLRAMPGHISTYADGYQSAHRSEIFECRGIGGASFFVRKGLYDKLNGFDEDFFLYDEDGDFCLRTLSSGCKNYVVPSIKVMTYPSATTSKVKSIELKKIKRHSRLLLISKHFFGIQAIVLNLVTRLTWRLL